MTQEQIEDNITYCFLDTNVFLHFQLFDTVDWLNVLDAQNVFLMLTTTVIEELDNHKDDHKNPGRKKRAREILSRLKEVLPRTNAGNPVVLKQSVTLLEVLDEPIVNWEELRLDRHKADDYIIASIISFSELHPSADIRFVTEDFPAQRKALRRNIKVVDPENKIARLEDFSLEAAEQRRKDRELQELKNRLPKLEIGFPNEDEGKLEKHMILPLPAKDTLSQNVEVLSKAFNEQYIPINVANSRKRLESIAKDSKDLTSVENVREFRKDYEKYLEKLEAATRIDYLRKFGHYCRLFIELQNNGTSPATGIEIVLQFPRGSVIIDTNDEGEEVDLPKEPQPKWMVPPPSSPSSLDIFGGISQLYAPTSFVPNLTYSIGNYDPNTALLAARLKLRGPICNKTGDTHIVIYKAPELQHETLWRMPTMVAYIWPDNKSGFPIKYQIYANELPSKTEGQLHISWEQQSIMN